METPEEPSAMACIQCLAWNKQGAGTGRESLRAGVGSPGAGTVLSGSGHLVFCFSVPAGLAALVEEPRVCWKCTLPTVNSVLHWLNHTPQRKQNIGYLRQVIAFHFFAFIYFMAVGA